ncbi:hypothetical protein [Bowmanella dokdonensis]|uniref:Uncharacterized protein n=1 Tax=Bowmanella dokdonensis TaxID=751969 RepID=A0A939DQ93_9ALTE|nr:hypothetical protein [Bowmanella dokdonensis]MBN7826225.1 hypothetical protein [Bowmanella dokdonensis]
MSVKRSKQRIEPIAAQGKANKNAYQTIMKLMDMLQPKLAVAGSKTEYQSVFRSSN